MKYGRLLVSGESNSKEVCNIGDYLQVFAMDIIYKEMGIQAKDVIDVPLEELGSFKNKEGGKVILPINGYYRYYKEHPAFPTSEDIDPVFLSLYTQGAYLQNKAFWKAHEPICCRDESTMQAMRRKGYEAYLLGCMTMVYPRRKTQPQTPKVFLVDAHPSIEKYIPEKLKPYVERICHDIPIEEDDPKRIAASCEAKARALVERYAREATLVITSRLHCATPCVAMGIPTIVVKDGFDNRFGFLDRFVHLYTPDEYDRIDWEPKPVECEAFKKELMQAAVSMLRREPDRAMIQKIHEDYMQREKKKLHTPLMVKGYMVIGQYFPNLADFMRNRLLRRFSITAKYQNTNQKV